MARRPSSRSRGLQGWYGESHVLHGVDFHVDEGEVVTLLGRNGAGRTSTLRAIMGLIGARKGSIKVRGVETSAWRRTGSPGSASATARKSAASSRASRAEENLMLPPTLGARRHERRADLRDVPEPEGARRQPGHAALGRRAADAGGRAHPAHRRAAAAARRDLRRPGAGDRAEAGRWSRSAARAGLHDRHGRAELPLRRAARRSLPRHGARPRDPAVHAVGAAVARSSGCTSTLGV